MKRGTLILQDILVWEGGWVLQLQLFYLLFFTKSRNILRVPPSWGKSCALIATSCETIYLHKDYILS